MEMCIRDRYNNRNDTEIGQKINVALNHIEERNSSKLRNVFRAIDFNSQVDFGEPKEKNATLRNLLEDFHDLDLRPSQLDSSDIIGAVSYTHLFAEFGIPEQTEEEEQEAHRKL